MNIHNDKNTWLIVIVTLLCLSSSVVNSFYVKEDSSEIDYALTTWSNGSPLTNLYHPTKKQCPEVKNCTQCPEVDVTVNVTTQGCAVTETSTTVAIMCGSRLVTFEKPCPQQASVTQLGNETTITISQIPPNGSVVFDNPCFSETNTQDMILLDWTCVNGYQECYVHCLNLGSHIECVGRDLDNSNNTFAITNIRLSIGCSNYLKQEISFCNTSFIVEDGRNVSKAIRGPPGLNCFLEQDNDNITITCGNTQVTFKEPCDEQPIVTNLGVEETFIIAETDPNVQIQSLPNPCTSFGDVKDVLVLDWRCPNDNEECYVVCAVLSDTVIGCQARFLNNTVATFPVRDVEVLVGCQNYLKKEITFCGTSFILEDGRTSAKSIRGPPGDCLSNTTDAQYTDTVVESKTTQFNVFVAQVCLEGDGRLVLDPNNIDAMVTCLDANLFPVACTISCQYNTGNPTDEIFCAISSSFQLSDWTATVEVVCGFDCKQIDLICASESTTFYDCPVVYYPPRFPSPPPDVFVSVRRIYGLVPGTTDSTFVETYDELCPAIFNGEILPEFFTNVAGLPIPLVPFGIPCPPNTVLIETGDSALDFPAPLTPTFITVACLLSPTAFTGEEIADLVSPLVGSMHSRASLNNPDRVTIIYFGLLNIPDPSPGAAIPAYPVLEALCEQV